MKWPPFLPDQVIVGNRKSSIAVVCGWAQREVFLSKLDEAWRKTVGEDSPLANIAIIGNLYTASRGIDIMIRNLLAAPSIRNIIFCGPDLSGASEAFLEMKRRPESLVHKDNYYTIDEPDWNSIRIWDNIPLSMIVTLLKNIKVVELRKAELLVSTLTDPRFTSDDPRDMPATEIAPPRINPIAYPSPNNLHPIRVKTIEEGYLELLYQIMKFGTVIDTHYGEPSRELMNLAVVISDQKLKVEPGDIPEYIPFDHDHLEAYYPKLITNFEDQDVTYTYGNLIRGYFGVDQIQKVAQKLAKDESSRSAVISLWDPKWTRKHSPCLNHLWFRIMNGALHMTATIRSNDMYFGWPENAYGLMRLQDLVRTLTAACKGDYQDDKRYALGDLTIISQSAHIYERDWAPALEIVEKHRRVREWWDEKGQWTFDHAPNYEFKATLMAPNGPAILEIVGSRQEILDTIIEERLVSDVGHALWLGYQLGNLGL